MSGHCRTETPKAWQTRDTCAAAHPAHNSARRGSHPDALIVSTSVAECANAGNERPVDDTGFAAKANAGVVSRREHSLLQSKVENSQPPQTMVGNWQQPKGVSCPPTQYLAWRILDCKPGSARMQPIQSHHDDSDFGMRPVDSVAEIHDAPVTGRAVRS
jgi:hypothetical protein